jgi:hypothetical protein
MPALQAQVDREQKEDPCGDLDPEVVRVAGEGVHPVHERAFDRAEDVDLARPARERLEPCLVEVAAGRLGDRELCQAVRTVRRHPQDERGEGHPVEAEPAARDQRDARDQEQEVEKELDHPLRPLRERLGRLQVEPPDQVHEEERHEERERHERCARELPVEALEPVDEERDQEDERDDVREGHRPRHFPLELGERDGEDGREEQPLDERGSFRRIAHARAGEGDRRHEAES